MKRLYIIIIASVALYSNRLYAQIPFNTMDSININKINAAVLVHGDMWWDPVSQTSRAFFNNTRRANVNFASAIWMSGYDAGNNLHVSAQTYRQDGNDYWPGPLTGGGPVSYRTSHDWAKIWKVNRTDIQYFQALSTHTFGNTPQSILTWPGKGNTYAQGNAGMPLSITGDMAPFVDLNGNGNYEPLLGEYPDIRGDQALWWLFNDNGANHAQSKGLPLGVEVRAMSYGYKRNTLIDNVVYNDLTIVNKSANNYHDMRLALFSDVDLGYFKDDYVGFDSVWRMGICYNGTNDDGGSAGHPVSSLGSNPPMVGLTMIVLPGDAGTAYVPVGSFGFYYNDNSGFGNPKIDSHYNNYIRARFANGTHFKDYAGNDVNYFYPDDPSNTTGWSECSTNSLPNDRKIVMSSNSFSLNAGSNTHIVFAMILADSAGGCPVASFGQIRILADTAWYNYFNPPPPKAPNKVTELFANNVLTIYPNPAKNKLFIEYAPVTPYEESLTIYNVLGQVTNVSITKDGKRYEVDIAGLPAGLYNVLYRSGDTYTTAKFVKE